MSYRNSEKVDNTPLDKKAIEELETHFDKWMYLLRHLSKIEEPPEVLQESTFLQLFEIAEIASFSPTEQAAYEDSLKYYRDLNSVVDTSRQEGFEAGIARVVIRQLEKKFESLSIELRSAIQALTAVQGEALSEALLAFDSLEAVDDWLRKHS